MADISGSGSELSSRHIPDTDTLSETLNTSVSFQIPGTVADDHLLADEDENDFFRNVGADISLALTHASAFSPVCASPAPAVNAGKDMENPGFHGARSHVLATQESSINTLNDLTEQNRLLLESKITVLPDSKQITAQPEANTRATTKKVEMKGGVQKKRSSHTQRKVLDGGITKSRIATSKKTQPPLRKDDPAPEELPTDTSSSSIFPMNGIAGRLIQYSHKYMDTFRGQVDRNILAKDDFNFPPQDSSIVPKPTQERCKKNSSNGPQFPADVIADSMKHETHCGPPDTETIALTEKPAGESALQRHPTNHDSPIVEVNAQERNEDIEDDRSKPLTISQLSPRKQRSQDHVKPSSSVMALDAAPLTLRTATKRPIGTDSTGEEPKLKRSKADEPKAKERPTKPLTKRKLDFKPRVPSGRPQTQPRKPSTNLSGSGSNSNLKKSNSAVTLKPAGIRKAKSRNASASKQAASFNPGNWNDDVRLTDEKDMRGSNSSLKSSGSTLQDSRIQNARKQDEKTDIPSSFKGTDDQGAPRPTDEIPQASESRSIARSQGDSQSRKHKFYHPAPNFKAIHAALDASVAQRKENIQPTVPLAMRWETESRMQERKKFDERVREKEQEKEKENEERKRHREAEQEREVKELRKKMVVKAHEVPEWYNTRPKKNSG